MGRLNFRLSLLCARVVACCRRLALCRVVALVACLLACWLLLRLADQSLLAPLACVLRVAGHELHFVPAPQEYDLDERDGTIVAATDRLLCCVRNRAPRWLTLSHAASGRARRVSLLPEEVGDPIITEVRAVALGRACVALSVVHQPPGEGEFNRAALVLLRFVDPAPAAAAGSVASAAGGAAGASKDAAQAGEAKASASSAAKSEGGDAKLGTGAAGSAAAAAAPAASQGSTAGAGQASATAAAAAQTAVSSRMPFIRAAMRHAHAVAVQDDREQYAERTFSVRR